MRFLGRFCLRKPVAISLCALLLAFFPFSALSQTRPPNDDLTNATVLIGTDITFNGSVTGATMEVGSYGSEGSYYSNLGGQGEGPGYPPLGSIWWSWKAPITTVLNLQVNPFLRPGYSDALNIFLATNGLTAPNGLRPEYWLGGVLLEGGSSAQWLSFPVTAGSNYLIELIGVTSNIYTFQLRATNAPVILKHPVSQTVYSNASAVFYVESASYTPRTFQWFLNGTNLNGETGPILALNHIDSTTEGNYSVLVNNAEGSVLSDSAVLAISSSNIPPVLHAVGQTSNLITFHLFGELGRAYRIESSTNLVDWQFEKSFPQIPKVDPEYSTQSGNTHLNRAHPESLVFATNLPLAVTVSNDAPQKFYRASIYQAATPEAEICLNNLKQILIAKQLWRRETRPSTFAFPTLSNILPYLSHVTNIFCPNDIYQSFNSSYSLEALRNYPECTVNPDHHALEGFP